MADAKRNEVIVPMGNYLYSQDSASGRIKTHVGPIMVSITGTDSPVRYMKDDVGPGKFVTCEDLADAICSSYVVPEGFYVVLMNPTKDPKAPNEGHPQEGTVSGTAPEALSIGHKVVIPGPTMFALWPGQHAKIVRGHSLRSNEYLLGRVYNEQEARNNWSKATVAAASAGASGKDLQGDDPAGAKDADASAKKGRKGTLDKPEDLTVGSLFIIRGTDVSFYIPPTGVSIVPEDTEDGGKSYIRNAVSLEQLEYCILVDEKGTKRIPRGPAVIFPLPTETFVRGKDGELKYRAIELNSIQGIHIKVVRAYHDSLLDREFKEGDEFFLTGKDCPIYFPREEHAIVRYDGNTKYFGVAIPAGEARYVMERDTGEIKTVHGPAMLLPDPVHQVIIRRVLSLRECQLWYPGNQEALAYNQALGELAKKAPTTRAGVVSEGEAIRASARMTKSALLSAEPQVMYSSSALMRSMVATDSTSAAGDEIARSSSYTSPRTLTLSTKFEGVPRIAVWTGFAVLVVDSKGNRRVEVGPKTILLEYDETLEILTLSTGRPKTTDKLLETPYLRVTGNKVSDLVDVETSDHVHVQLKLSYHINFDGDAVRWWDIQNYVKHACDHMRSALKAEVRRQGIERFYASPIDLIREVILGKEGHGCSFKENGMKIGDVELMQVEIPDGTIRALIAKTQQEAVQRSLMLSDARSRLTATRETANLKITEVQINSTVEVESRKLEIETMGAKLASDLAKIANGLKVAAQELELLEAQEQKTDATFEADAARKRAAVSDQFERLRREQELALTRLKAEAEAISAKFSSIKDGMSEALLALGSQEAMVKIAEATSVQRLVGGDDVVDVLKKLFAGTGLGDTMKLLAARSSAAGKPDKEDKPVV